MTILIEIHKIIEVVILIGFIVFFKYYKMSINSTFIILMKTLKFKNIICTTIHTYLIKINKKINNYENYKLL